MVQSELHPEDEGREGNGDPGESGSDQATPGVPESLTAPPAGDGYEETASISADPIEPGTDLFASSDRLAEEQAARRAQFMARAGEELVAWFKTFASAAVYATLIVTFGFQVARVEGKSMEPTLQDQDRLIVNKAAYRFFGKPKPGDIVMLYYPRDPDKSFVKRIVAEAGDTVRIEDGHVYVNEILQPDLFVPPEYPESREPRSRGDRRRLLLRDGRPSQQQLGQSTLGTGAAEVHHRPGAAPVVAPDRLPAFLI